MGNTKARQAAKAARDERRRRKAEREFAAYKATAKPRLFVKAYGRALRAKSW